MHRSKPRTNWRTWVAVVAVAAFGILLGLAAGGIGRGADPVEAEIRGLIVELGGYQTYCTEVARSGGIEAYILGEGGSGTPFPESDWDALAAIHDSECAEAVTIR